MISLTNSLHRGDRYLATSILVDLGHPDKATVPATARFGSDRDALIWLRDRARRMTFADDAIVGASIVIDQSRVQRLRPIRHMGVGTALAMARQLDDLVLSPTSDGRSSRTARSVNVPADPARKAVAALDRVLDQGLTVRFTDPAEPRRVMTIGMIDRAWTAVEYRQSDSLTACRLRKIGPVGLPHYARVTDLFDDLALGAPYCCEDRVGQHLPPMAVPPDVRADLTALQRRIDTLTAEVRYCACDNPEALHIQPQHTVSAA
ncbi:hypothetical protein [Nocardia sp. BMG51109]|uniref:hypothetical protein n=1 Tax=Nocardia sp. BMG51109 TaxID=1056816 RepID=UPI000467DEFC|nr:hypothetical protein [Nocardia sp. BMG51109]